MRRKRKKISFAKLSQKEKEKLSLEQLIRFLRNRVARVKTLEVEIAILNKMIREKMGGDDNELCYL